MNDNQDQRNEIEKRREYSVIKRNELIQKGRFSLTLNQQKTLLFLISQITDGISIDKTFKINISDYCKVAGIKESSVTAYYAAVKSDIKKIADASVWVRQPNGQEVLLRWLDIVRLDQQNGEIEISFSKSIEPYLFFFTDRGQFTSYPLLYVLPMGSPHGIRLYELLKSYANMGSVCLTVEELKMRVDAMDGSGANYTRFVDFRRYVLDRAISDINQYTDLSV